MYLFNCQIVGFSLVYKFLRILFILCSIFEQIKTLNLASFIGPLRSNDRFAWIKITFSVFIHRNAIVLNWKALASNALIPGNHQKGPGLFIGVALVLARPFQPQTILFRWMKIETTQLLFVQSMLNRSSNLSGSIKLAKFRLFIYSKLEPKINKSYRNLYVSEKLRVWELTRCVYFRNTPNTSVCFSLILVNELDSFNFCHSTRPRYRSFPIFNKYFFPRICCFHDFNYGDKEEKSENKGKITATMLSILQCLESSDVLWTWCLFQKMVDGVLSYFTRSFTQRDHLGLFSNDCHGVFHGEKSGTLK